MSIQNIPLYAKSFCASHCFSTSEKNILLLADSEDAAISYKKQLDFLLPAYKEQIKFFPSLDTIAYDRISPNHIILAERAKILTDLAISEKTKKHIFITNACNLLIKLPPPETFTKSRLNLAIGDKITTRQISEFLSQNGFYRSSVASNAGEFAVRGEIIDVVLSENLAYRIGLSWDKIDYIKHLQIESQVSKPELLKQIYIDTSSEVLLGHEQINYFRDNFLTLFGVNHTDTMIYTAVTEGRKFPGYENLLPMFYKALASINDYLNNPLIIYDHLSLQSILEFETSYLDLYQSRLQSNKVNPSSFYPALPPARLYFSSQEVKDLISHHESIFIDPGADNDKQSIKPLPSLSHIDKWQEFIGQNPNKILILCAYSPSGIERFKTLMNSYEYHFVEIEDISSAKKGLINLVIAPFASGYITDDYIFITGRDIFGEKYFDNTKSSSKRRLKNILTELDNLQPNELVVHIEHGIGKFLGVEIIEVQGNPHDCLKILYADNDKLYIPVEDIDSIKKYGHNEAELDRLGSLAWQKRKSKLKNKISEIAATLIKTAASRALTVCEPIEFDVEAYEKFCDKFNYAETEDQLTSINDIQEDFKSGKLMDRLICGDVGFGKTEVAMRATYMIAAGQEPIPPQVAIVVPTTILCGQHYTRFLERFQGFPFRIAQLSRLITPKQAKAIKEDLQNGKVNILIGTHALLSKEIKFQNLRLLIIDEEQHFGVAQKEHLKELKTSVHTISLSATPIPRTLQMSMVGIKDLSLIATPPIDRLAIRTTVMPFDGVIIRDALLRERFRGGRSFYVAPRIKDLEDIAKILKEIVPELTFKIAHGQMSAASIDDIMTEFYEGKFDILLSTTIVESGIDVSSANTIVIHKADKLGLSQLYQLRGRIGRGKLRGYAYLTLDPRKSSPQALRRLEIMQSIDSLGAGFTIASHDMDLRGFGNLVGEEQSGHVKEVGSELYQEMLDQAIAELQNEPELNQETELSPSINLGLPVFIPDSYIEDSALRLGIYRRVGNLLDSNEVEKFIDEMVDRFGPIPDEFKNLLEIVKLKKLCNLLHISNLDSGEKGFLVKFWEKTDVSNVVLSFITSHPRHAKIRPDNKLVFLKNLNPKNILQEAENFLNSMMMR